MASLEKVVAAFLGQAVLGQGNTALHPCVTGKLFSLQSQTGVRLGFLQVGEVKLPKLPLDMLCFYTSSDRGLSAQTLCGTAASPAGGNPEAPSGPSSAGKASPSQVVIVWDGQFMRE